MSDPVTNVEIEDVLSSIRRLVSDGDKARTRDPAPQAAPEADTAFAQPSEDQNTPSDSPDAAAASDRLVLTPAFLVVDSDPAPTLDDVDAEDHDASFEEVDENWTEDTWADEDRPDASAETAGEALLTLTNPIAVDDSGDASSTPSVDRADLVATIAELEAAVSAGGDEYEPDGSEVDIEEAIAFPGAMARKHDDADDAELSEPEVKLDAAPELENDVDAADGNADDWDSKDWAAQGLGPVGSELQAAKAAAAVQEIEVPVDVETEAEVEVRPEATTAEATPDLAIPAFAHRTTNAAETDTPAPTYDDAADVYADEDDLDGLLDDHAATIDPAALRALVAEVVREELSGPMGEKITRNVRKLVRREIYRILSSQEFD